VITVIAVSLLTITVLGIGIYQFLQYQREQDQERLNSRVYRSYVRHTDEAPAPEEPAQAAATPAPRPSQVQLNQEMTRKLLAHPGVTPGAGFSMPGVKSTGVAIIDAIDQAQAREKASAAPAPSRPAAAMAPTASSAPAS
jgi:hypothetical protein